jgi:hypothetical protein
MRACGNRLALLICGLVVISPTVLAQRHGTKPVEVAPAPLSKDEPHPADYDGFTRKVALQATPEQMAQFQRLRASTQAARQDAREALQYTASGNQRDMFHHTHPLTDAVDEALDDNERFLLSFSAEQQDGLKKFSKKLRKSDSALDNHNKALSKTLDRGELDAAQIAELVGRVDKALSDFQSEQSRLAAEMGIQTRGTPELKHTPPDVVLKR